MLCDTNRSIVLIIDELVFRRTGLASVVKRWARAQNLGIEAIASAGMDDFAARNCDVRFVMLGVGGLSLNDPQVRNTASKIAELFPGKPYSVISDLMNAEEAILAAELSAHAFLSTNMDAHVVYQAFTFILGGGTYFPREALLESGSPQERPRRLWQSERNEGLSRRQVEVLAELGLGKSNKLIARDLRMRESTVKVHMRQIMRKLGAANRTQAALLAGSAPVARCGVK